MPFYLQVTNTINIIFTMYLKHAIIYKSNTIRIKKVLIMNKLFVLVGPSAAGKTLIDYQC